MARPKKIWLRTKDNYWYVTHEGKKVRLSKDKAEAEKAFRRLQVEADEKAEAAPEKEVTQVFPTFRKVADLFLKQSHKRNKPTTIRMHEYFLQSICDFLGKKRVADLKETHVDDWIDEHEWGESTQCSARGAVLACLNWAVQKKHIHKNPLLGMKRGSHKRRERVFTADEIKRIREFTNPCFADFLLGLELTGARPFSELALITAEMVNWEEGIIQFAEHKTSGKGKSRTIYLVPQMVELLKRLAEQHPEGLLFRNTRGKLWTSHDATRRLHYCTESLGIPRGTIYAIRHYLITSALEEGLNANVIGELVGNSPITISRHYDHLSSRKKTMKEAAKKALGIT